MYLYNANNYENKQIKQRPYIFDTPSKLGDLTLKIECCSFLTPNYELCNRIFTELRLYFSNAPIDVMKKVIFEKLTLEDLKLKTIIKEAINDPKQVAIWPFINKIVLLVVMHSKARSIIIELS